MVSKLCFGKATGLGPENRLEQTPERSPGAMAQRSETAQNGQKHGPRPQDETSAQNEAPKPTTGLGHKRKPHHFRPRAGAILAGPWVVWGRRAAGEKTMNQPLARARARASARLSQTAASANTRLRSQPLQTRKRSGTAPAAFVTPCSPFAHARARAPFQPPKSPKRSGTPAPNDPKTTQKRSRLRPENGASKSGNESLCPSLGVATAERTRRRKSQKMPLPELRRALTEL